MKIDSLEVYSACDAAVKMLFTIKRLGLMSKSMRMYKLIIYSRKHYKKVR